MLINSTQQQWAVGQGFFHTGHLVDAHGSDLMSYAVDCGSVTDVGLIEREIDDLMVGASYAPPTNSLDLVFLTHFDADHVNGVRELHRRLAPRHYVIPRVSLVERLLTAARVAAPRPWPSWPTSWYWDFITDPANWLRRLPGRPTVTIVDPRLEPGNVEPQLEREVDDTIDDGLRPWRTASDRVPNGSHVAGVRGVTGQPTPTRSLWTWQTYVATAARTDLQGFEARLTQSTGFDPAGPQSQIREIIDQHWYELVAAYKMTSFRRNRTSLCVYSGPAPWVPSKSVRHPLASRSGAPRWTGAAGPGWLGAGDAHLRSRTSAKEFTDAFALTLDQVGTFAIPHHGAKSSWNEWLLDAFVSAGIPTPVVVVGAQPGHRKSWRHPDPLVETAVKDRSGRLVQVTKARSSRWASRTSVHF